MLFNSTDFFIFLIVLLVSFNSIPSAWRWRYLLVASFFFYMYWEIQYGFLLLFIITTTYLSAKALQYKAINNKRLILSLSIAACLIILAYFKYYNFIIESINTLSIWLGASENPILNTKKVILPVGISFYTFQALSYNIDVYKRGNRALASSFGKYALFVSFFPQLVAGPIERSRRMLDQYSKPLHVSIQRIKLAFPLLINGLFKKIVIADNLKPFVDSIFQQSDSSSSLLIAIALLGFSIQIYCDFSGYSDMAIAIARMFGVYIMQNFRAPYLATSLQDFWHRWHISLSTWFRDYVYIPLGGNRHKLRITVYRNLFITFLISGLWHGASWSFVIWGALHGIVIILENLPIVKHIRRVPIANRLFTMTFVYGSWMYFRAESFTKANDLLIKLIKFKSCDTQNILDNNHFVSLTIGIIAAILLLLQEGMMQKAKFKRLLIKRKPIRNGIILFLILLTLMFASASSSSFIYFQF